MKEPIFNLTPEEQEIEDAIVRGEYVSRPATAQEKERFAAMARYTLARLADKRIGEKVKWLTHDDVWKK